jgi:hypothetical protein
VSDPFYVPDQGRSSAKTGAVERRIPGLKDIDSHVVARSPDPSTFYGGMRRVATVIGFETFPHSTDTSSTGHRYRVRLQLHLEVKDRFVRAQTRASACVR